VSTLVYLTNFFRDHYMVGHGRYVRALLRSAAEMIIHFSADGGITVHAFPVFRLIVSCWIEVCMGFGFA
jgi:hypothetical protein